jgi:hypothetical protein
METDGTGRAIVKCSIKIGGVQKYKKFLTVVGIEGWRDSINQNPNLLYSNSQKLRSDYLLLMQSKFHSNGAADAFSYKTQGKLHTAAVYILSEKAITVSKRISKTEVEKSKTSLLGFLSDFGEGLVMNQEYLISLLFPSRVILDSALVSVGYWKNAVEVPSKRLTNRLIKISIPQHSVASSLSLEEVCVWKWKLEIQTKGSLFEKNLCWGRFKDMFPWLMDTHNATVENSPFEDALALSVFIRSQRMTTTSCAVTTCIRQNLPLVSLLNGIIKYGQGKMMELRKIGNVEQNDEEARKENKIPMELHGAISLMLTGPRENDDEVLVAVRRTLSASVRILKEPVAQTALSFSQKELAVAMFQEFCLGNDVKDLIRITKKGVFGYSLRAQKKKYNVDLEKNEYLGEGEWIGTVDGVKVRFKIYDRYIYWAETNDISKFITIIPQFKRLLRDMNITYTHSKHGKGVTNEPRVYWSMEEDNVERFLKHENDYIEIILNEKLHVSSTDEDDVTTALEVDDRALKIIARLKEGDKRVVLFSHVFSPESQDLNIGGDIKIGEGVVSSWINKQSVDFNTMVDFCNSYMSDKNYFRKNNIEKFNWFANSFQVFVASRTNVLQAQKVLGRDVEAEDENDWYNNMDADERERRGMDQYEDYVDDEEKLRNMPVDMTAIEAEVNAQFNEMQSDLEDDAIEYLEDNEILDEIFEDIKDEEDEKIRYFKSTHAIHPFWINVFDRIRQAGKLDKLIECYNEPYRVEDLDNEEDEDLVINTLTRNFLKKITRPVERRQRREFQEEQYQPIVIGNQ